MNPTHRLSWKHFNKELNQVVICYFDSFDSMVYEKATKLSILNVFDIEVTLISTVKNETEHRLCQNNVLSDPEIL